MTSADDQGTSHYLRVLRRGVWIVLFTVAIATAAAVYVSSRQTRLYSSSADVFLSTQNLASELSSVPAPSVDPAREAATQADLARTPLVAQRALAMAGLSGRSAIEFLKNSSVTTASDADILTFSVTDRSPQVAERLAEDYATAYTQYRHQLDTAAITTARDGIARQLAQLRRAGDQDSSLYASLVEKDQQLSTLQVLQGSNALLVRSAGPASQVQPRPIRNAAVAAVLGLLLGIGLAFLRDTLNTRVRDANEVEQILGLTQLGRLPPPPRQVAKQGGKRGLVMLAEPFGAAAEPFRILATNIDFVNLERSARSIMFTSATHREGKSTTVSNVAIACARGGRRVALVDLDLRKPSIAGLFGMEPRTGLTSVLLGQVRLADALVDVPISDVSSSRVPTSGTSEDGAIHLLPVGPLPPNAAELVGSTALAEILAELESAFDFVLIDTPPLLDLSDAMTLSARVDALVVVTKLSVVRRSTLQELRRVLEGTPTTKLGFVATGVRAEAYAGYGYAAQSQDSRRKNRQSVG